MKKKFAVAMAITAGLCFAGIGRLEPAFAGYWEVVDNPYATETGDYDWEGEGTYQQYQEENASRTQGTVSRSFVYDSVPYSTTQNWQDQIEIMNDGNGFPGPGANMIFTDPGTTGTVTSTGKRKIWFHWVKNKINGVDDPTDIPPTSLHLQIHSSAYAVLERVEDYVNVELETSVGDGSASNYTGDTSSDTNSYSSLVEKNFPLEIPTNGEDTVSTPWLTFSGSVKGDRILFNPDNSDFGDVNFGLLYQLDTRAVHISGDLGPTHYKDGNGERQAHTRNADGTMTVDTVAAWTGENWYWENGALGAVLLGDTWNQPEYLWQSDNALGSETTSVVYPLFGLGGTSEASGPAIKTVHVGLAVTDDDNRVIPWYFMPQLRTNMCIIQRMKPLINF